MTPEEARAAIAGRPARGTRAGRTPEEAKKRQYVASKAQAQAFVALRALHKDDYDALYQVAKADLLTEAGLA